MCLLDIPEISQIYNWDILELYPRYTRDIYMRCNWDKPGCLANWVGQWVVFKDIFTDKKENDLKNEHEPKNEDEPKPQKGRQLQK